jgi:hypothetical protein
MRARVRRGLFDGQARRNGQSAAYPDPHGQSRGCIPRGMAPAKRGIPLGVASHEAWRPTGLGIPRGRGRIFKYQGALQQRILRQVVERHGGRRLADLRAAHAPGWGGVGWGGVGWGGVGWGRWDQHRKRRRRAQPTNVRAQSRRRCGQGVSPVPAQMCAGRERSPGADVGRGGPSPGADAAQMRQWWARCGLPGRRGVHAIMVSHAAWHPTPHEIRCGQPAGRGIPADTACIAGRRRSPDPNGSGSACATRASDELGRTTNSAARP